MGKMDLDTKVDVMAERASEQDGFKLVEWTVQPADTNVHPDNAMDNGCGCDCGCGCS